MIDRLLLSAEERHDHETFGSPQSMGLSNRETPQQTKVQTPPRAKPQVNNPQAQPQTTQWLQPLEGYVPKPESETIPSRPPPAEKSVGGSALLPNSSLSQAYCGFIFTRGLSG